MTHPLPLITISPFPPIAGSKGEFADIGSSALNLCLLGDADSIPDGFRYGLKLPRTATLNGRFMSDALSSRYPRMSTLLPIARYVGAPYW